MKGIDMRNVAAAITISMLLGGCASTMSGLDGGSQFACKAPDGVTCSSLSGVYANAVSNNLPALRKEGKSAEKSNLGGNSIAGRALESGSPIRSQPKILRVWLAPWEDMEGDLHDQSYIYVVADPGRWLIEHNQKRIVDRYRPTFIQSGAKTVTPANPSQSSAVTLPGAQMYGQNSSQQPETGVQE